MFVSDCIVFRAPLMLLNLIVFILNYSLDIFGNLIVLVVTWRATYTQSRGIVELGQRKSLSAIVFRDGELSQCLNCD